MPLSFLRWRPAPLGPLARRALTLVACGMLSAAAWAGAFLLAFDFRPPAMRASLLGTLPLVLAVRLVLVVRFGLDRGYLRHVGLRDLLRLAVVSTLGSLALPLVLAAGGGVVGVPAAVFVLDWLLTIVAMAAVPVGVRVIRERHRLVPPTEGKRAFIIGAGESGELLLHQIVHDARSHIQVVGLIDDDPAKRGRSLHGVSVVGSTDDLRGLVALHRVRLLLIAIPSASVEQLRRLVDRCAETGAELKLVPPGPGLVDGNRAVQPMRDVVIEDLLGRDPVRLDVRAAERDIAGQVVLITGAGGSIGSELARQVAAFHPRRLILLERAESPLYFIHLAVAAANPAVDVVPVLASVTNADRLAEVFARYRPDLVFHAAAYKHVPMLEANVAEGVWNNVVGTLLLARAAVREGTRKFVLISTDKAVNPSCVLGATKRLAERVVRELPSLRTGTTDFRVVRFGNVLGSDGSVVPLFQRQLAAGGPLTVTHPEMRRYLMTIGEAVLLVLEAAALPDAAGRIAILEMGSQIRILDLAEQMIRLAGLIPYKDVDIVFKGLRPGEKLEEELLGREERAAATAIPSIRLVERNGAHGSALARGLRALVAVAARGDDVQLIRTLGALVPEYQPDEAVLPRRAGGNGRHRGNGRGLRPEMLRLIAGPSVAPRAGIGKGSGGNGNGNGSGNGNGHHRRETAGLRVGAGR